MSPQKLDRKTKARIEAEEKYRAEVRAKAETTANKVAAPPETDEEYRLRVRSGFEKKAEAYTWEAMQGASPERQTIAKEELQRIIDARKARIAAMSPEERKVHDKAMQRKNIGNIIAAIVIIGGLGAGLYTFFLVAADSKQKMDAGRAQAAAKREEDSKIGIFAMACEDMIRQNLKAPSTADFSNFVIDQDEGRLGGNYGSGYTWKGYVDSENAFGATLRSQFVCTAAPNGGAINVSFQ